MKVPGCTMGIHSDVKPVQVKQSDVNNYAPKPIVSVTPQPVPAVSQQATTEQGSVQSLTAPAQAKPFLTEAGKYKCCNTGCSQEYEPEENVDECCSYHPGKPVFRDTKKYWTCCEKYSYEWDDFMKLETCRKGKHIPKTISA